jgi:exodeoxyribonuclease VII small subunit
MNMDTTGAAPAWGHGVQSGTDSPGRPAADIGYEEAIAELDSLIDEMESGRVGFDDLSVRFGRAVELIEALRTKVAATQLQVHRLNERLAGAPSADVRE